MKPTQYKNINQEQINKLYAEEDREWEALSFWLKVLAYMAVSGGVTLIILFMLLSAVDNWQLWGFF